MSTKRYVILRKIKKMLDGLISSDEEIQAILNGDIDKFIQKNAEFRANAGMSAKIIRTSSGHCCEWCNEIAGTYNYPDVPKDVYRRHDNCDCTVEYVNEKMRQNVWTKKKD